VYKFYLYSVTSHTVVLNILLGEHVAQMGDMRNAYKILFGKPEWKEPLEISMLRRCGLNSSGSG
jgi:hypothetical protein